MAVRAGGSTPAGQRLWRSPFISGGFDYGFGQQGTVASSIGVLSAMGDDVRDEPTGRLVIPAGQGGLPDHGMASFRAKRRSAQLILAESTKGRNCFLRARSY